MRIITFLLCFISLLAIRSFGQDSLSIKKDSIIYYNGYQYVNSERTSGQANIIDLIKLSRIPSADVTQQLQGRLPGLYVNTSSQPGEPGNAYFRGPSVYSLYLKQQGINTLNDGLVQNHWIKGAAPAHTVPQGFNNLIYIVDGVPINDISMISPYDIKTVTLLKDPASIALYGGGSYHGVLLVSTYQDEGSDEKLNVNYQTFYNIQFPGQGQKNLLNSQEFADLVWLTYKNSNLQPNHVQFGSGNLPNIPDYVFPAGLIDGDPAVDPALYNRDSYQLAKASKIGTNWYKESTHTAAITHHNLKIGFKNKTVKTNTSFDIYDHNGMFENLYFKRYTAHENFDWKIFKNLTLTENIFYSYRSQPNTSGSDTYIESIYNMNPLIPVMDIAGNWTKGAVPSLGSNSLVASPLFVMHQSADNTDHTQTLLSNTTLKYTLGGFAIFSNLSIVNNLNKSDYNFPVVDRLSYYLSDKTIASNNHSKSTIWNKMISYTWQSNNNHYFNVLAGQRSVKNDLDYYDSYYINSSLSGQTQQKMKDHINNFFGVLDYNFRQKYFLKSSFSGLHKELPGQLGVEASWDIAREKFFKFDFISSLRFNGGYGIIGSEFFKSSSLTGKISLTSMKINSINFGLSSSLMKGKINIYSSFYKQEETNVAKNTGAELGMNGNGRIGNQLKFSVGLVFSHYKNNIYNDQYRMEYGQSSFGSVYGYLVGGIAQSQAEATTWGTRIGNFKFQDLNNDGLITSADRTIISNANPDFTVGIDLNLYYKRWSLSGFLYAATGFQIYNNTLYYLDSYSGLNGFKSKRSLYESWTPDRQAATTPIVSNSGMIGNNSYFVEDGSYVKLKTLKIEYSIPQPLKRLNNFKLYIQGNNLFTSSNFSGIDPEISQPMTNTWGRYNWQYPNLRQIMVGAMVSW